MTSKERKVVSKLSILVKIIKEVKVFIIQKVIYIYILPIFTYRLLVWWPKPSQINK